MITIACCLWDANASSFSFSRMYDETWVEKLYRGVARNLRQPFRFVCHTDIAREFSEPAIEQVRLKMDPPDYACLLEPLAGNGPVIIMGLDTVITGPIDHLADYARTAEKVAVPRDPFHPETVCNGVVLAPRGCVEILTRWKRDGWSRGQMIANDMEWFRRMYEAGELAVIDDLWPGEVVSYKGTAKHHGIEGVSIVYFHGSEKPHELASLVDWIGSNWL